jgi:acetyltransferase-like isoleucine patch superfamily enzyme
MTIKNDVKIGKRVKIYHKNLVNLYGCSIGDDTKIGTFVEIQAGAKIGSRCKISSHTFICEGVTIEDEVFIGHGVMFTNDKYPRAAIGGHLKENDDWKLEKTVIKKGASVGSGAIILPGIIVGENAMVGAGCVVSKDVPSNSLIYGVPGKIIKKLK